MNQIVICYEQLYLRMPNADETRLIPNVKVWNENKTKILYGFFPKEAYSDYWFSGKQKRIK